MYLFLCIFWFFRNGGTKAPPYKIRDYICTNNITLPSGRSYNLIFAPPKIEILFVQYRVKVFERDFKRENFFQKVFPFVNRTTKKNRRKIDGSDFVLDNLIISYSEIKDLSAFLQLLQEQHLPYIQPVHHQYRREEGV